MNTHTHTHTHLPRAHSLELYFNIPHTNQVNERTFMAAIATKHWQLQLTGSRNGRKQTPRILKPDACFVHSQHMPTGWIRQTIQNKIQWKHTKHKVRITTMNLQQAVQYSTLRKSPHFCEDQGALRSVFFFFLLSFFHPHHKGTTQ